MGQRQRVRVEEGFVLDHQQGRAIGEYRPMGVNVIGMCASHVEAQLFGISLTAGRGGAKSACGPGHICDAQMQKVQMDAKNANKQS